MRREVQALHFLLRVTHKIMLAIGLLCCRCLHASIWAGLSLQSWLLLFKTAPVYFHLAIFEMSAYTGRNATPTRHIMQYAPATTYVRSGGRRAHRDLQAIVFRGVAFIIRFGVARGRRERGNGR